MACGAKSHKDNSFWRNLVWNVINTFRLRETLGSCRDGWKGWLCSCQHQDRADCPATNNSIFRLWWFIFQWFLQSVCPDTKISYSGDRLGGHHRQIRYTGYQCSCCGESIQNFCGSTGRTQGAWSHFGRDWSSDGFSRHQGRIRAASPISWFCERWQTVPRWNGHCDRQPPRPGKFCHNGSRQCSETALAWWRRGRLGFYPDRRSDQSG